MDPRNRTISWLFNKAGCKLIKCDIKMDNCIFQHNLHLQYFQTMMLCLRCVYVKKKTYKKCLVNGLLYKTIAMFIFVYLVLLV